MYSPHLPSSTTKHANPTYIQVKYHDIHHWFPESNYGQYIMLWDRLMGSFKSYPGTAKSE